jgi:hypothetical protein
MTTQESLQLALDFVAPFWPLLIISTPGIYLLLKDRAHKKHVKYKLRRTP